jgi:hypothetical protein
MVHKALKNAINAGIYDKRNEKVFFPELVISP